MSETLFDYLRRRNPNIIRVETPKTYTTNSRYLRPSYIERWHEISPNIVKEMYADILARSGERAPIHIKPNELRVRNEGALQSIISQWNRKVVEQALKETQEHLGSEDAIYMEASNLAKRMPQNYVPDWATIHEKKASNPDIQVSSIMPGDTKYGWSSQDIVLGPVSQSQHFPRTNPMWAIMQIFSYCVHLRTRYGYIITDKELVLFRIGLRKDLFPEPSDWKTIESGLRQKGTIAFESIPWSNNGIETDDDALSVNLALWWIHLQAVKDNTIRPTYPPLVDEILKPPRKDSTDPIGEEVLENAVSNPTSSFGEPEAPYHLSFQVDTNEEPGMPPLEIQRKNVEELRGRGSVSDLAIPEQGENIQSASQGTSFRSETSEVADETGMPGRKLREKRKAQPEEIARCTRSRQRLKLI